MPLKLITSGGGSVILDANSTASTVTLNVPAAGGALFTSQGGTISGNVGINASTTTDAFNVSGTSRATRFRFDGASSGARGTVVSSSAVYTLSGDNTTYGYGISTNVSGGLDIMANQTGQDIRFYCGTDNSSPTERVRIDSSGNLQFNSGYGSVAVAYGVRSWVNFTDIGGITIRASRNVSSITDDSSSHFINFTNAMPDANFVAFAVAESGGSNGGYEVGQFNTGGFRIWHTAGDADVSVISCCAIR